MRIDNNLKFDAARAKIMAGIALYGTTAAAKLEGEAKRNAPWIDRTTNARNSIQGRFTMSGSTARITLSGNIDYFVFLELAMGKKYAIIAPTLEANVSGIINGYKKVIG